jgi:type I restriction enzyme M protein
MIIEDGRKATLTETKKSKEIIYTCDLIPEHLVINRYFSDEKKTLTELEGQLETITARIEELAEEHG